MSAWGVPLPTGMLVTFVEGVGTDGVGVVDCATASLACSSTAAAPAAYAIAWDEPAYTAKTRVNPLL